MAFVRVDFKKYGRHKEPSIRRIEWNEAVILSFSHYVVAQLKSKMPLYWMFLRDDQDPTLWKVQVCHHRVSVMVKPTFDPSGRMRIWVPKKSAFYKSAWTGETGTQLLSYYKAVSDGIEFRL